MTSNKVWNVSGCVAVTYNLNILAETEEEAIEKFEMLGPEGVKEYVDIDWSSANEPEVYEYEGDDYDID